MGMTGEEIDKRVNKCLRNVLLDHIDNCEDCQNNYPGPWPGWPWIRWSKMFDPATAWGQASNVDIPRVGDMSAEELMRLAAAEAKEQNDE